MYIDGWTIAVLVLFFAVAAVALYRCLMSLCNKLCEYQKGCEQATSQEER